MKISTAALVALGIQSLAVNGSKLLAPIAGTMIFESDNIDIISMSMASDESMSMSMIDFVEDLVLATTTEATEVSTQMTEPTLESELVDEEDVASLSMSVSMSMDDAGLTGTETTEAAVETTGPAVDTTAASDKTTTFGIVETTTMTEEEGSMSFSMSMSMSMVDSGIAAITEAPESTTTTTEAATTEASVETAALVEDESMSMSMSMRTSMSMSMSLSMSMSMSMGEATITEATDADETSRAKMEGDSEAVEEVEEELEEAEEEGEELEEGDATIEPLFSKDGSNASKCSSAYLGVGIISFLYSWWI